MKIELSEESIRRLEEIRKAKTHSELSIEWLVERAILRYYDKKMDDFQYAVYRSKMLRRRLSYQSWMCWWCQCPLTLQSATLDHLLPLDRGGKSEGDNLVVSCAPCNFEKGEMTAEEYVKFRASRYGTG